MKNILKATLVCLLLVSSLVISIPASTSSRELPSFFLPSTASSPKIDCLASNVTAPVTLINVDCTQQGSVVVSGSGSITLMDSSLVLTGKGNYAQINLTQSAKLVMQNSSISNSTIDLTDQSNLTASSGSVLSLEDFRSSGPTAIYLLSSSLVDNYRVVDLSASAIDIEGSSMSFTTPRSLELSANVLAIQNSKIYSTNSSSLSLNGNTTLLISGSYIANILDTTLSQAVSSDSVDLTGSNVSVISSSIISSGVAPFGYPPAGGSSLNVTAGASATISYSNLTAGNINQPVTFKSSKLLIGSGGSNLTIANSFLQSLSNSPSISLSANSQPLSYLSLLHSILEEQNASGLFQLSASYSVVLEGAKLDGPQSNLKVFARFLQASDSTINDANATRDLTFGYGLESGTFSNTTFTQCSGPTQNCLFVAAQGGSYYVDGVMLVQVTSGSNSQPVANASVSAIDSRTGHTVYLATTNSSGWAKIKPLLAQATFGNTYSIGSYIIQASSGGLFSPEELASSNQTIITRLSLSNIVDIQSSNLAADSQDNISTTYGFSQYSYLFNPPNTYKLGPYIGAEYLPYVTILSNAVPLNYKNNASFSEIDFSTFGDSGGSFYFVAIYPKNFTNGPLSLRVDGGYQGGISQEANATHYFTIFSIPSGFHRIALVFNLRNGNSIPVDYPSLYPSVDVMILAGALVAVGLAFASVFALRRKRGQGQI